ncbi:hypothetical protein GN244_ATG16330 [Phytophthora infestans]|uniref:Uncharacterized protein n=1 Tax=Phytophthora infestans TaxID=4787 RepID=A0A833SU20_PHYIN|nr:hypothetical protein GN244_ATG16330 [Phytophthora infestans]KAF4133993.1 hypothetical protein GN958_ATG16838 [Phytophthora infestans]
MSVLDLAVLNAADDCSQIDALVANVTAALDNLLCFERGFPNATMRNGRLCCCWRGQHSHDSPQVEDEAGTGDKTSPE